MTIYETLVPMSDASNEIYNEIQYNEWKNYSKKV